VFPLLLDHYSHLPLLIPHFGVVSHVLLTFITAAATTVTARFHTSSFALRPPAASSLYPSFLPTFNTATTSSCYLIYHRCHTSSSALILPSLCLRILWSFLSLSSSPVFVFAFFTAFTDPRRFVVVYLVHSPRYSANLVLIPVFIAAMPLLPFIIAASCCTSAHSSFCVFVYLVPSHLYHCRHIVLLPRLPLLSDLAFLTVFPASWSLYIAFITAFSCHHAFTSAHSSRFIIASPRLFVSLVPDDVPLTSVFRFFVVVVSLCPPFTHVRHRYFWL
jgi:hypothetical protein